MQAEMEAELNKVVGALNEFYAPRRPICFGGISANAR